MNNGLIYNNLNTLLRKEKEGQTISPEQFSELLQECSWEKANTDYSKFERNQIITDSLRSLKTSVEITVSDGVGDISEVTDYWHVTGAVHSTDDYAAIPIDIVSDVEYQALVFSDLEKPEDLWPILKMDGSDITVSPSTIVLVSFRYLKKPNTPYYDYYSDVDDNIVYLAEGVTYTLQEGETSRSGIEGPDDVTSDSKELSFPDGERSQVLYMMLSKLGISLNEQDATQYALTREQKEQAE